MTKKQLQNHMLPNYTRGEEIMNMVTHIVAGALGIVALTLCVIIAASHHNVYGIVGGSIYGFSMIALYTVSSVYHGLRPSTGKKILQIVDHCTIYCLIAGTYTPIALCALRSVSPALGWGMLVFQWVMAAFCITLTAIDMKKYRVLSMICYIGMGWAVLPFMKQAIHALTMPGFQFLLWGGIAYSLGAVLYGIGSKKRWFHCIFHIFVFLGSLLQLISILFYVL